MHSYSWIFSDEDVDMEAEVEDVTSGFLHNKEILEKEESIPFLRRSYRLVEQSTGLRKRAKRVMEEKGEVRMDKVLRKPWNYGTVGRKNL